MLDPQDVYLVGERTEDKRTSRLSVSDEINKVLRARTAAVDKSGQGGPIKDMTPEPRPEWAAVMRAA